MQVRLHTERGVLELPGNTLVAVDGRLDIARVLHVDWEDRSVRRGRAREPTHALERAGSIEIPTELRELDRDVRVGTFGADSAEQPLVFAECFVRGGVAINVLAQVRQYRG